MEFDSKKYLAEKIGTQSVAFDPKKYLAEKIPEMVPQDTQNQDQGIISTIGDGVVAAGKFVDSYTGAPTRAALNAGINGNNPISAFGQQFGEDPSSAPTGKEIATNMGFDNTTGNVYTNPKTGITSRSETSNAGVVGLGIDLGADISNFVPAGAIVKGVAKGGLKVASKVPGFALKGSVAAIDLASGTSHASNIAETTSKYIDRVVESTKSHFNPKVAEDFGSFTDIAKANGIDPSILPETVEFGKSSSIAKKSQHLAEGPGGDPFQAKYFEAHGAVENAMDKHLTNISGGASIPTDIEAGNALIEGHNNGIKAFFDQDMITHKKVINSNPGMVLTPEALKNIQSKMKGLKNHATGLSRRGTSAQIAEAKSFLSGDAGLIERSLDKNGNLSYKRGAELLTNIGNEAFQKVPFGSKPPANQVAMKDLYFSIRDSMYESSAHVLGPEAATELAMNNTIISDFLKDSGKVAKIFEGNLAPEKLFERVANGDSNQINALKEILSPEDFSKFKGALLNKTIIRNAEGAPLYKRTLANLAKKKSSLSIALQPEETKQFADLLRLGDRIGQPVLNTSSTHTASRFDVKKFAENIIDGGVGELELEKLKEIARGKASAIKIPSSDVKQIITPKQAQSLVRKIPLFTSSTRQAVKGSEVASIQERNKEIERRKRAISGSKP